LLSPFIGPVLLVQIDGWISMTVTSPNPRTNESPCSYAHYNLHSYLHSYNAILQYWGREWARQWSSFN